MYHQKSRFVQCHTTSLFWMFNAKMNLASRVRNSPLMYSTKTHNLLSKDPKWSCFISLHEVWSWLWFKGSFMKDKTTEISSSWCFENPWLAPLTTCNLWFGMIFANSDASLTRTIVSSDPCTVNTLHNKHTILII